MKDTAGGAGSESSLAAHAASSRCDGAFFLTYASSNRSIIATFYFSDKATRLCFARFDTQLSTALACHCINPFACRIIAPLPGSHLMRVHPLSRTYLPSLSHLIGSSNERSVPFTFLCPSTLLSRVIATVSSLGPSPAPINVL
uniref:Uncharacterized protein n=1 Tax=Tetraselmis chuii TaxID=63592 RepID=A0A7S1T5A1_9CHLO|mmetsp:Transcript_42480/g.76181  ORF Transcript_42480/g.76181 Transcript_42480/m.76181 type:complete len:143 (+) Transcript_42480:1003-1431(+)